MEVIRNYKYRIYPTPKQEVILRRWEGVLCFLWNLCLEQRKMGLARPKDERVFVKNIAKDKRLDQSRQMTDLLVEYPWIGEVQCQARQKTLENLDVAWQRVFKGLAKTVHFKSKIEGMGIYVPCSVIPTNLTGDRKTGRLSFSCPAYRKLGTLKIVLDRSIPGKVKSWTLVREGSEWYAIACNAQTISPPTNINIKEVGIDRGVVSPITDSDGRLTDNPRFYERFEKRINRLKRRLAKQEKGSNNRRKTKERLAKLERTKSRQRNLWLNTESKYYADNYGKIVIEALNIENMTRSAKGTIKEPGKNIKQKSGLNRSILDVGWGMFGQQLEYKLVERGGELVKVMPNGTSQTCPSCGHCDAGNRPTRDLFKCLKCGHEEHADIAASKIILQRSKDPKQVKQKRPPKKMIKRYRQTAVKPTVVQPVENSRCNGVAEAGTIVCEDYPRKTETINSEDSS